MCVCSSLDIAAFDTSDVVLPFVKRFESHHTILRRRNMEIDCQKYWEVLKWGNKRGSSWELD